MRGGTVGFPLFFFILKRVKIYKEIAEKYFNTGRIRIPKINSSLNNLFTNPVQNDIKYLKNELGKLVI